MAFYSTQNKTNIPSNGLKLYLEVVMNINQYINQSNRQNNFINSMHRVISAQYIVATIIIMLRALNYSECL